MNKKLFSFLFLFLALSMMCITNSCKKDDDSNGTNPIIGTWKCTASGSATTLDYDEVTFKSDQKGSWKFVYKDGKIEQYDIVSWGTTETKLTIELKLRGSSAEPTTNIWGYSVSGSELILSWADADYLYKKQ